MRHKSNLIGILVAAAITMAAVAGDARAAMIQFKPRAAVSSRIITLGDVANVLDADASLVEKLEKIVLAPAPVAGGQTRLEFADIRSRLQATGINLAQTEFAGATSVLVTVANTTAGNAAASTSTPLFRTQRDRVEKLLVDAVKRAFAARDSGAGQLVVQVQVDDRDVTRILQCNTFAGCEVVGGDPHVTNDQTVTTRFSDRKGNPVEFTVRCRVSAQPQILTARYTIPPGHILREADLVWRQAANVEGVVARMEDAVNRETRRSIRQDEPIRDSDIRAVPLVRTNDIVTVISRRGGVVIKAEMKSRGEGTTGETVTLVSLKGQDLVLARVTGLHEAEVITADGPTSNTLQDATGRIEFRGEQK